MAQGTIELIKYLTTDSLKAAESHCDFMERKSFKRWTDKDRAAVITLINAFDIAAIMVRSQLADEKLVVDNWGALIRRMATIGAPLIAEARRKYNTDSYWDDFEWLASRPSIQHG